MFRRRLPPLPPRRPRHSCASFGGGNGGGIRAQKMRERERGNMTLFDVQRRRDGRTRRMDGRTTDSFSSFPSSRLHFQNPSETLRATNSWHLQVCWRLAQFCQSLVYHSFLIPPSLSDRPQLGLNTLLPLSPSRAFSLFSCQLAVCCQIKCLPLPLSASLSVSLVALFVLAAATSSSHIIAVTT